MNVPKGIYVAPNVSGSSKSLLVYRLGYGPFKAEGGVRFPGEEMLLSFHRVISFLHENKEVNALKREISTRIIYCIQNLIRQNPTRQFMIAEPLPHRNRNRNRNPRPLSHSKT